MRRRGWTDPRLIPQEIVRAIENAPANVLFPGFVDRERLRALFGKQEFY